MWSVYSKDQQSGLTEQSHSAHFTLRFKCWPTGNIYKPKKRLILKNAARFPMNKSY